MFYSILSLFIFVASLFGSNREHLSYKLNLIGCCWYFLISLFSWIWFSILIGLNSYLEDGDKSGPLIYGFLAGIIHCVLLCVYCLVFLKSLKQFFIIEQGTSRYRRYRHRHQNGVMKFIDQTDDTRYLAIVSPTFYTDLKNILKLNKDKLIKWKTDLRN